MLLPALLVSGSSPTLPLHGAGVLGLLFLAGVGLLIWRLDGWGRALLVAGLALLALKVWVVAPIEFVGASDGAAYAEMAWSLVQGRGLEVDYVSWYFDRYDPGITRPEDHWPPLYSFLVAPCFAALGRTALAAKLPNLLLSCLVLPLAGQALGRRLSRSGPTGLVVGLALMVHPLIVCNSLMCMADVLFTTLVLLAAWLCVRGMTRPDSFLWAGLCGGLALLAKGNGVVVLPVLAAGYLLMRGSSPEPEERPLSPWLAGRRLWALAALGLGLCLLYDPVWAGLLFLPALGGLVALGWLYRAIPRIRLPWLSRRDRVFLIGLCLGALVASPWLVRNAVHFGSPLYSTNQYVAGYIGWKPWEESTHQLYWGGEGRPSLATKLSRPRKYARWVGTEVARNSWQLLGDLGAVPGVPQVRKLRELPTGGLAVLSWLFLAVACSVRRRGRQSPAWLAQLPVLHPGIHLTWLVPAGWVAFLSLLWGPWDERFLLPALALVTVAAWVGAHALARRLFRSSSRAGLLVAGLALLVLAPQALEVGGAVAERARYPFADTSLSLMDSSRWLGERRPDAVVITRDPWDVHFYAQVPAVQIPNTNLADTVRVARYFGVTHLIPHHERPHLQPWLAGEVPGLRRIHGGKVPIYEIHYEELPVYLRDLPPLPPP